MIGLLRPYQVERLGSFLVGAHEAPTGSGSAHPAGAYPGRIGPLFGRAATRCGGCARGPARRETDLALASLVGQWGFVVGEGAVLAALILVWRLAFAARARTPRGALVGGGMANLDRRRDRRVRGPRPWAAPAGQGPAAAWLRRHRARRAPGRDRRRPCRAPRRRPQAAMGAAALAEPAARLVRLTALGLSGAAAPSGSTDGGCRAPRARRSSRPAGTDDALHPAAGLPRCDHRSARRCARRERRRRRQRRGPGPRGARVAAGPPRATSTAWRPDPATTRGAARAARTPPRTPPCRCRWPRCPGHRQCGHRGQDRCGVFVVPGTAPGYPNGTLLGPVLGFAGMATPRR